MSSIRPCCTSLLLLLPALAACGTDPVAERDFHTSGSREADQRAEQRVAKVEQMHGEGEGGEADRAKRSLYERLGGGEGVRRIVDDFVERAVADPRANWERKGMKRGGVLGIGSKSAEWRPTAENLATLKAHLTQFVAVASGGPSQYDGRDIVEVHKGMQITNAEFDAAIGALKATLDTLRVPTAEQKELLAVLESTRPQIAEKR
jgi:hemoglobin